MLQVPPRESAPTPEVAAYLAQKEVAEKSRAQIWRRVGVALGVALLISVGSNIYNALLTHDIRTTQVANTTVARCQVKTFDAILKDARLAFAGDKKASDYAQAPTSC